jgi:hypothetical protein
VKVSPVPSCRCRFNLPKNRVFVSRDALIPGYSIGIREPYAIVFSEVGVGGQTSDLRRSSLIVCW